MSLDLAVAFPEIFTIVIYSERDLLYNDLFYDVVKTYILYSLFVLSHLVRCCAISIVILSAPPAGNLLCMNAMFVMCTFDLLSIEFYIILHVRNIRLIGVERSIYYLSRIYEL